MENALWDTIAKYIITSKKYKEIRRNTKKYEERNIRIREVRIAGIEPAPFAWKANALPLCNIRVCSRRESNPRPHADFERSTKRAHYHYATRAEETSCQRVPCVKSEIRCKNQRNMRRARTTTATTRAILFGSFGISSIQRVI